MSAYLNHEFPETMFGHRSDIDAKQKVFQTFCCSTTEGTWALISVWTDRPTKRELVRNRIVGLDDFFNFLANCETT